MLMNFVVFLQIKGILYVASGTILILHNQKDWLGGVGKMIMLNVKWAQFTNDDWLQAGWVGFKKAKILIT